MKTKLLFIGMLLWGVSMLGQNQFLLSKVQDYTTQISTHQNEWKSSTLTKPNIENDFLKKIKDPSVLKESREKINSYLVALGFTKGIGSLTIANISFISIPKNSVGNYWKLNKKEDSIIKVTIDTDTIKAFRIKNKKQVLYFLDDTHFLYLEDKEDVAKVIQSNTSIGCRDCKQTDLIYDFKCKKLYMKKGNDSIEVDDLKDISASYKKGFRFKIVNLNRYLYNSSITVEDVTMSSSEPELFKKLFLGEGFNFKGFTGDSKKAFTNDDDYSKFETSFEVFKNLYNSMLENYIKAYSICPQEIKCCSENEEADSLKFQNLSKSLLELKLNLSDVSTLINDSISKTNKEIEDSKKGIKDLEDKLVAAPKEKKAANIKSLTDKKESLRTLNENLTKFNVKKEELDKFKIILDAITDEKILELIHFKNNFVKENFEYITPTIYPLGNSLSMKIKISPNTNAEVKKWQIMPLSDDEFNIEFRVRNKWFYSFSTGPFVGISNSLRPESYGWQAQPNSAGTIDATSQYKLVSTGKESMPVGLVGFANFGVKTSEFFGFGLSIGAGATIKDNTKIAYLAGVTVFAGQDKQFNLTFGLSFIQVDEIKSELYPKIDTQLYSAKTDLESNRKFVNGLFVACTYSIFTPTKTKNIISDPVPASTTPVDSSKK